MYRQLALAAAPAATRRQLAEVEDCWVVPRHDAISLACGSVLHPACDLTHLQSPRRGPEPQNGAPDLPAREAVGHNQPKRGGPRLGFATASHSCGEPEDRRVLRRLKHVRI